MAARVATSGEYQHGSVIIKREEGPTYRASFEVTDLSNVAKNTKTLPPEFLSGHGGIAASFQDYARPLVGALRAPTHLSDYPVGTKD
jgi:hypothetical protein